MKVKATYLALLIFIVSIGCTLDKTEKHIPINNVYVGLSSMEAFKLDKGDSAKYFPPPLPLFDEEIANNNIIEGNNGKIYFYSFKKKQPICGYMTENGKYKFELYKQDLDALKTSNLIQLDTNNCTEIIQQITRESKPVYVSIGLQQDTSKNHILQIALNLLYKNSVNNVWKVRRIIKTENELISQL